MEIILKQFVTQKSVDKFIAWQNALPPEMRTAIGGRLTLHITPTSIGIIVKITDCISKQEIDLTEYENW